MGFDVPLSKLVTIRYIFEETRSFCPGICTSDRWEMRIAVAHRGQQE